MNWSVGINNSEAPFCCSLGAFYPTAGEERYHHSSSLQFYQWKTHTGGGFQWSPHSLLLPCPSVPCVYTRAPSAAAQDTFLGSLCWFGSLTGCEITWPHWVAAQKPQFEGGCVVGKRNNCFFCLKIQWFQHIYHILNNLCLDKAYQFCKAHTLTRYNDLILAFSASYTGAQKY